MLLPDESPVLFFDVSVIIFVIRTRACELDKAFTMGEVFEDGPVKKFGTVIAIKAKQRERQRAFDVLESQ